MWCLAAKGCGGKGEKKRKKDDGKGEGSRGARPRLARLSAVVVVSRSGLNGKRSKGATYPFTLGARICSPSLPLLPRVPAFAARGPCHHFLTLPVYTCTRTYEDTWVGNRRRGYG